MNDSWSSVKGQRWVLDDARLGEHNSWLRNPQPRMSPRPIDRDARWSGRTPLAVRLLSADQLRILSDATTGSKAPHRVCRHIRVLFRHRTGWSGGTVWPSRRRVVPDGDGLHGRTRLRRALQPRGVVRTLSPADHSGPNHARLLGGAADRRRGRIP